MRPTALTLSLCLCAAPALSAEPKKGDKGKPKMEKLDLGLGNFGSIPKGIELEKATPKKVQTTSSVEDTGLTYEVVRVVHGKSFLRTPQGAQPSGAFDGVQLSNGNPPMTDKFSSVVRVKCAQKMDTSIEVAILDPRGDTVMEASGTINWRDKKNPEAEWTVDWDPSPVRGPGEFKVLVRVGGSALGTYPLKMIEAAPKK